MLLKRAIRLLKTKQMMKKWLWSTVSKIYMVCGYTDLDNCVALVNIFRPERTRVEVWASFYYSIKPLN